MGAPSGQRMVSNFSSLDKRARPSLDTLVRLQNGIIDRDRSIYRRPSLSLQVKSGDNGANSGFGPGVHVMGYPARMAGNRGNAIATGAGNNSNRIACESPVGSGREEDFYIEYLDNDLTTVKYGGRITGFKHFEIRKAGSSSDPDTLVQYGNAIGFVGDSGDDNMPVLICDDTTLTYPAYQLYASDHFHAIEIDTATPESVGGYRSILAMNGESHVVYIQRNQAAGNFATDVMNFRIKCTPISLSGCDPVILDSLNRAKQMLIHRQQMFYLTDDWPNHLFFSLTPGAGPRFYEFDDTRNNLKIDSGSDSPIVRIYSYADSVYVFTARQIWRVSGNLFDGAAARVAKVADIGLASFEGIEIVSSSAEATEIKDSYGKFLFITNERDVVLFDGVTAQTVSDPIAPLLESLNGWQLAHVKIRRMATSGMAVLLWPSKDLERTEGIFYDYLENRWCGEFFGDYVTAYMDYIDGVPALATSKGCELYMGVYQGSGAGTDSYGLVENRFTGCIAKLDGTEPYDLDFDWTHEAGLSNLYWAEFKAVRKAIDMWLETHLLGEADGLNIKQIHSLSAVFNAYGDWSVKAGICPDGTPNAIVEDISMLPESGPYGNVVMDEMVWGVSNPYVHPVIADGGYDATVSGLVKFLIYHYPDYEESLTVNSLSGAGAVTTTTFDAASPGGFSINHMEYQVSQGGTFRTGTHKA